MTMANRDMGLLVLTSPTLLAMQARLDAARCEIDFEVYAVPSEVAISLELHLQALAVFFVEMCQESIPLDWLKTTATRLPQERVLQLIDHREPGATQDCLFHAFCDPPYGPTIGRSESCVLFHQWCDWLGLRPEDGIEVMDWVGDPTQDPRRSEWSDYFDAGKEWWGIWCLTIWNPVTRTIGVLAASTTD